MSERSLAEAAAQLGVSADTVRRRIKDGTLSARKDAHGRLLVQLADDDGDAPTAAQDGPRRPESGADALLAHLTAERDRLAEQVRFLADQLDRATKAQGELRQLLAREQARTLALPAATGQPDTPPTPATPAEPPRRRWWPFGR